MKRKFDGLGRITIPKELRKELGMGDNAEVEIELSVCGDEIIISKASKTKFEAWLEEQIHNDHIDIVKSTYELVLEKYTN